QFLHDGRVDVHDQQELHVQLLTVAAPGRAPSWGGRRGPNGLDMPAAGSADQMILPVEVKIRRSAPTSR
ncbi:hypothetical protein, partial [Streptomyces sp. NPDC059802]|uniref:hypothetical protein n=1 Tax=Streptomyces sp. NPDC059802 TaxID=3346952 RepID=UPI003650A792